MTSHAQIGRRKFVQGTAAAMSALGIGYWSSAECAPPRSANEKLNIGCIGVGGKGWEDTNGVAGENIYAICDVDAKRLAKAAEKFPKAATFADFRKLLELKEIDAVTVSTPDHTHAVAGIPAMQLGKHLYCQKPLTHNIHEARLMTEIARKQRVATQMGNQGHSDAGTRRMVEWIQAGGLGDVREAHVWTNRPIWPQGMDRPEGSKPVPSDLSWDLWLGPAAERPYNSGYHPFRWRGFWDFGTGALGDMACHCMDTAFWALELGVPKVVSAKSSGMNPETAPEWSIIRYSFPARGNLPPVELTWYDGNKKPPAELAPGHQLSNNGSLFVGDAATLYAPHYWGAGTIVKGEAAPQPNRSIPDSPGHYLEWIRACKGGGAALSNFDYAGPLTEMVLLGNLALRLDEPIRWDSKNLTAEGLPEADRLVRGSYRKGWAL